MIELKNITYEYPNKVALKNVSFEIKSGNITALVGPNGAGKTTLMRCIAALDKPFSGEIFIDGVSALENPREVHKKIGYLSDFFGVYENLTTRQCLIFNADINEIPSSEIAKRIDEISKDLGLFDYLDVVAGSLSRGLRQRLGIAQAIIHNPKVLLLDEPASGLDPEARISLSALFKKLQEQGMTLLISSHIISELEEYCSEMLLLREGEIVNHSKKTASEESESQINKVKILLLENAENYVSKFLDIAGVSDIQVDKKSLECIFTGDKKGLNSLLKKLIEKEIPLCGFHIEEKRLRDIYMDYAKGGNSYEA